MKIKPIIVVCGEPFSIFSELFIKLYKNKYFSKFKKPIINQPYSEKKYKSIFNTIIKPIKKKTRITGLEPA